MTGDVPEAAYRLAAMFREEGRIRTHSMPENPRMGGRNAYVASGKAPVKRGPRPRKQRPRR